MKSPSLQDRIKLAKVRKDKANSSVKAKISNTSDGVETEIKVKTETDMEMDLIPPLLKGFKWGGSVTI